MKSNRSISSLLVAASLALAALGASGAAQAQDVFWSVGMTSPGVQLGLSNARPVVVQSAYQSVYVQQNPVYVVPQTAGYRRAAPVLMAPPNYVQVGRQHPGNGWGWRHRHGHHEYERGRGDRYEGGRSDHGHQNNHRN